MKIVRFLPCCFGDSCNCERCQLNKQPRSVRHVVRLIGPDGAEECSVTIVGATLHIHCADVLQRDTVAMASEDLCRAIPNGIVNLKISAELN